jgi:outer membrane protein TolC
MRVTSTKKRLEELEQQSREYLNSQVQNIIASVMTNYYDIVRQQSYARLLGETIEYRKRGLI